MTKEKYDKLTEDIITQAKNNGKNYLLAVNLAKEKKYKDAINSLIQMSNFKKAPFVLDQIGIYTLLHLQQTKNVDSTEIKKAIDYFKLARRDTLFIFSLLSKNKLLTEKYQKLAFQSTLDNDLFFAKITSGFRSKKKTFFEEIYLSSIEIVSLLHISREEEKEVAHYTTKGVCELFITENTLSPFRLNTITTANDPKEGFPLLNFLDLNNNSSNNDYQAFVGCFIFNPDCLNQFRLYGKENGQEATGVSIVINSPFFSSHPSTSSALSFNDDIIDNIEPLYRCIYVDPLTKKIISIGHKEEQIFYRENINTELKTIDEYKKYIYDLTTIIKDKLNLLKKNIWKYIENLKDNRDRERTQEITSELLIHLRYLVKHSAFKEEQECRIIRVEPIKNGRKKNIKIDSGNSRMYINYRPLRISKERCHIKHIYFAPKATGINLMRDIIKYENLDIQCHQSDLPFS